MTEVRTDVRTDDVGEDEPSGVDDVKTGGDPVEGEQEPVSDGGEEAEG